MNATLTVDKAGRIVLPKPVRDELQLFAGDSLDLHSSEDRIILRPVRGAAGMRQKKGVWIFRTGRPISTASVNETIRRLREEREQLALHPQKALQDRHKRAR